MKSFETTEKTVVSIQTTGADRKDYAKLIIEEKKLF